MATPPLPDIPCIRVRLDYRFAPSEGGNRFFVSYTGGPPSGADCTTIAGDIATAWTSFIAPLCSGDITLVEIDVLDIASDTGFSGQWTGSVVGSRSGTGLLYQSAANVEYDIARRYRGGKPRIYLPAGVEGDLLDQSHWDTTFINSLNSDVAGFFGAVEAITAGSTSLSHHVNLSFYSGVNPPTTDPGSGRVKQSNKYRATALHDNISGYAAKAMVSSQRRRRAATTF
jgi:hypothetical protein